MDRVGYYPKGRKREGAEVERERVLGLLFIDEFRPQTELQHPLKKRKEEKKDYIGSCN